MVSSAVFASPLVRVIAIGSAPSPIINFRKVKSFEIPARVAGGLSGLSCQIEVMSSGTESSGERPSGN